jgi:hypothetical protein
MAAVPNNGTNPGRAGRPMREEPGRKYNGRASSGDPTNEPGQPATSVFGLSAPTSTGLGGSAGSSTGSSTDVTMYDGQLEQSITGLSGAAVTSSGLNGVTGASPGSGGTSVTYTDPFGFIGGVNRSVQTSGTIDGVGDWTQANRDGYAGGPTLPILQNNRPTSTGLGAGHVSTHRKG